MPDPSPPRTANAGPALARAAFVALCAALALPGCGAVRPKPSSPGAGAADPEAGPFAPVQMRIHPLTRARHDADGRPVIEAHLELFDRWGHSVKGLGEVEFEFAHGDGPGRRSLRWTIDLTDPDVNSRGYFDYVTRTYLVTLRLEDDTDLRRRAALRATFTTPAGRALAADYELVP